MLIRLVVKNLFSFKDQTEFNLFPNKTTRLAHHKIKVDEIDVLRMSAIYGANGSGKSNLIKSISLLQSMIETGEINSQIENKKFKLSEVCKTLPVDIGIEFFCEPHTYYYSLSINGGVIVNEYFAQSKKEADILIFERNIENGIQKIKFFDEYYESEKNKLFASVLEEKILEKNQLLFSFLSKKYEHEFIDVKNAYDWFDNTLTIIKPDAIPAGLAHILESVDGMDDFANNLIKSFNTGIDKLGIEKRNPDDFFDKSESKDLKQILAKIRKDPTNAASLTNPSTGEEIFLMTENDEIVIKRLYTQHSDEKGNNIEFSLGEESDGTRRLLDYIPALHSLVNTNKVFLIDEIERSIHPLTIKEIISKYSLDEDAKGQLIFTTHESSLLDQDILRTDEIWFCQKNLHGASKLYSLSDYKVHNTIDIENGYLNGRYGGIPFLSNLHHLNWHKYNDVK